ncbi:MAG: PDGLE domain-containing protein [Thermodesulfovibrionales bacterium]|nr:PDGLE domain-containing protein [Thermodesulfovibrionales bacterium]
MANLKLKIQNLKFRKLWMGIAILIILSPVGLILPELFKTGGAWGEWGADEIEKIAGYVPHGLKKLSELWKAPILDYAFLGWDKGFKSYAGYIFSGIIGAALVIGVSMLIGKFFAGENGNS